MKLAASFSLILLVTWLGRAAAEEVVDPAVARVDAASGIHWYDLRRLEVEGQGWGDTKAPYDRLPRTAEKAVRAAVWDLSRHAAGICARFVTDATEIHVQWELTSSRLAMPHMPATGVSGVDLYVRADDGAWRWLAVGRPTAQTNTARMVAGIPPGKREFLLYLPLYNGVKEVEIGIPGGKTLARAPERPADRRKPIVFYGTSITHGACASRPGMAHPAILGRWFDRPVINLGFSGNGRMEKELAQLLTEIDAAAYVIDCLPNIVAAQVTERTEPLVRTLREARPGTPIVLVEDRNYADSHLVSRKRERNLASQAALKTAFRRLQAAGVRGLHYLEGDRLLGTDRDDTVDSSHPSDLGFFRQAEAFHRVLAPALGQERPQAGSDPGSSGTVGAYYYPWYRAPPAADDGKGIGWMSRALRGRLRPRQLPRLGVYDSRDPAVIKEHIAQSRRGNIAFWAVSWWGPGHGTDVTFRDHILAHADAGQLKYAALYESTGRFGRFSNPSYGKLVSDFEYLAKTYFEHPHYLRIDGRPVVFIYLTRVYFRDRGLEPLARLRERFPQLYLVGDDVFGPRYRRQDAKLWDAVTAYDVYGQCLQRRGATQGAIEQLRQNFANARRAAHAVGTAFIPAISPGFNDRAVRDGHVGRVRFFTDRETSAEGDLFRQMIRQVALPFADDRTGGIFMVTSFNEWYEDTQIEATKGDAGTTKQDDSESGRHFAQEESYTDYGFLYLDILREELKTVER